MPNAHIVPQKIASQQVNTFEAMPTMYKDKAKVPPFFLRLRIFRKKIQFFFRDSRASCNIMPISIAQRLGVTPQPSNQIVIQLNNMEVEFIKVLKDFRI